jgi:uncharacterized membrane protein
MWYRILGMMFVCHRLPERSYFFRGRQFPMCARCTGIGVGYILAAFIALFYGSLGLLTSILLIIPTSVDGTVQLLLRRESTNNRRLITGIAAGVGVVFVLYHLLAWAWGLGFEFGQSVFFN